MNLPLVFKDLGESEGLGLKIGLSDPFLAPVTPVLVTWEFRDMLSLLIPGEMTASFHSACFPFPPIPLNYLTLFDNIVTLIFASSLRKASK